jgi:hypothetical protein
MIYGSHGFFAATPPGMKLPPPVAVPGVAALAVAAVLVFSCLQPAAAQDPPAPATASANGAESAANSLFTPANQVQPGRVPHLLLRVFRRLAHDQSALIPFTETRQFAISKQPVRQSGVLRSSKEHGLSMAYEGAKPRILIIDDKGLIERQPDGRERQISVADHPELAGLTDLYLNLLRGNSDKLFDYADVYFTGTVHGWELGLNPRVAGMAKRIGRVVIHGSAREMHQIENVLPNGDTRNLELGPAQRNPRFTPEAINTYFRGAS